MTQHPPPNLIFSDRTYRQLARFAVGTMGTGATPLPGGFWSVPVDAEVAARVAELRQPDESDDATVWRLMLEQFPLKEIDQ